MQSTPTFSSGETFFTTFAEQLQPLLSVAPINTGSHMRWRTLSTL